MTTKTERSDIKGLHGIESSSRSSYSNYRDASNGTSVWKNNPTIIQTPVNARSRQTTAAQVLSQGGNPRGGGYGVAVGNTTSRRTLTGCQPRKKQKTDEGTTFGGNARRKQLKEDRPVLAPEIIEVDDEDHDSAHPSTDDILLRSPLVPSTSRLRSTTQNHDTHSYNHAESSRTSMSRPPRSGNVVVPDGKDTEWLERKIDSPDDDSIGQFSDEETNVPRGKVKSMVNTIEAKSIPQIDLRKIKQQMKPRAQLKVMHPESTTQRDRIATSSTNFFNGKDSKQPRAAPRSLPVKEFFIGTKHYEEDKPSVLSWTTSDRIEITHGPVTQLKNFDVRTDCSSVTYSTSSSRNEAPVVKLDTYSTKRLTHKAGSAFKTGTPCTGSIVVKFDTSHPNWVPSSYQTFTEWLRKNINKSEKLSGQKAADSVWEQQYNCCGLLFVPAHEGKSSNSIREAVANTSSKKRAAPDESTSEDDVVTPPRTVESRAASRTSRRPSPPIEIASPHGNVVEVSEAGPLNLRRSTRRSTAAAQAPQIDPDEVILVYPHGVPGAVNITNADMGRLDPGEFLNDTLIEFGLKLWLRELEDIDPELAKQIHVFNSFFYKKLNKKNFQEGYNSVRKWTSRFDLFQKKYIIVPINENLHWYLAIIYEPEHVLLAPVAQRQTRSQSAPKPLSKNVETIPTQNNSRIADCDGQRGQSMSETEVEEGLHDFQSSCSITATSRDSSTTTTTPREQTTTATVQGASTSSSDVIDIDMDDPPVEEVLSYTPNSSKARSPSPMKEDHSRQPTFDREVEVVQDAPHKDVSEYMAGIPPSKFYASSKNIKHKPKEVDLSVMEIHDDAEEQCEISAGQPQTYVITLDSLGGPHKQAVNQLAKYLKLEAKDKKGIEQPSSATGLVAAVPTQPNFCDCGVYLLHLAQTFMKDPQHYFQRTLASSNKKAAHSARRLDWNDSEVGQFRENMASRIQELSVEWKREKEEVRKKEAEQGKGDAEAVSESDSEVDIVEVETRGPVGKLRGRPRTTRHGPAARVRG